MLLEVLSSTISTVDLVSHLLQRDGMRGQGLLGLARTNSEEDSLGLVWNLETTGEHRKEKCLVHVLAEASNFSGRAHLYTERGVGTLKTGERELRCFDTNVVEVKKTNVGRSHGKANHSAGSKLDEVGLEGLADKREGTRCAKVQLETEHVVIAAQELHVERTSDVECSCDVTCNTLDTALSLGVELLGREHKRSITRVNTSVLHVLRDSVVENGTVLSDSIEVNLLAVKHELGHHNRVLNGDISSILKEVSQLLLVRSHTHGSSTENVGRTHNDGVSDVAGELVCSLRSGSGKPCGLVHTDGVKESGELVTVLSAVDRAGRSAENTGSLARERKGKTLRDLTTNTYNNTHALLGLVNIENALEGELLEVKAVRLIVVSRHGLRVVVDDNSRKAILAKGANTRNGTPIKLNGATNAVRAVTKNHDSVILKREIVLGSVVCHVKIVGLGRELSSKSIDLLHKRGDAELVNTATTHRDLVRLDKFSDTLIRKSVALERTHHGSRDGVRATNLGKLP
mmetsp:Transcript_19068/g.37432  ORF Transcript_19068/g.37432 Transcript_19068/m.37432 type:complete len:514 (-) Transcript_19068:274-1815(-)